MKDFNKSDYSINKNSKNIVYISQKTGARRLHEKAPWNYFQNKTKGLEFY